MQYIHNIAPLGEDPQIVRAIIPDAEEDVEEMAKYGAMVDVYLPAAPQNVELIVNAANKGLSVAICPIDAIISTPRTNNDLLDLMLPRRRRNVQDGGFRVQNKSDLDLFRFRSELDNAGQFSAAKNLEYVFRSGGDAVRLASGHVTWSIAEQSGLSPLHVAIFATDVVDPRNIIAGGEIKAEALLPFGVTTFDDLVDAVSAVHDKLVPDGEDQFDKEDASELSDDELRHFHAVNFWAAAACSRFPVHPFRAYWASLAHSAAKANGGGQTFNAEAYSDVSCQAVEFVASRWYDEVCGTALFSPNRFFKKPRFARMFRAVSQAADLAERFARQIESGEDVDE